MKLSARQLCFFLAAVAPAGKLVLLPSQLAAKAGNDLLFPLAAHVAFEAALVFLVLLLARRERTVYAMIADMVGGAAAKAACILLAAFLLWASFVPLIEQKLLVQTLFYDTLPSYVAFTPFFLLAGYLCDKPLASMGRLWDILAPLFCVGLTGVLLFACGSADLGALAPVGGSGAAGFWRGLFGASSWFFDAALLLPLLGHFPYQKGLALRGALCYLAGGGAVVLFCALYFGVFQELAVSQPFAFSQMSKYFSGVAAMGRVDYIFIFSIAFVMLFYTAMPVQAAVDVVAEAFARPRALAPALSAACNAAAFAALLAFNFVPSETIALISVRLFWIFPAFSAGMLLVLYAAWAAGRRRRHAQ